MAKRVYVGNLPWSYTPDDLQQLFQAHGTVVAAEVISDRDTGRSRGFGFVEMDSSEAAEAAIDALNGVSAGGRLLKVNVAHERARRHGGNGRRA
jgi:RNA recognition motif-containing protein